MTEQDKADRLAAALRENLKRRKAQVRSLAEPKRPNVLKEALEILAGPQASTEWQGAVAAIKAAAADGNADALERRAVIECMGVGEAADWNRALDTLAKAAEGGSVSAQGQLRVIAEDQMDGGWTAARSRIQLNRRLAPPSPMAARTLSVGPLVRVIPNFASKAECDWLIHSAAERLKRAEVYSSPTGYDEGRTNSFALFDVAHSDLVVEMIRARIANEIRAPLGCLEIPQVLRYRVGEQFTLHCDFLDPQRLAGEIARLGQRPATFLIYLNEDFDGGETSFPVLGIDHRGKTGDALIFGNLDARGNPDPRSQHAGTPPTRGEKWVFSQWVRSKTPA